MHEKGFLSLVLTPFCSQPVFMGEDLTSDIHGLLLMRFIVVGEALEKTPMEDTDVPERSFYGA